MLTLLYFSYGVVLEYSWKRRYRALSLKNHWTGHGTSSPVKWRITVKQRAEVVFFFFLPKRKALQPRKRYFGLFFEHVEQQQEILYFAVSKRFKRECAGREASACSNCAVSWSYGRTILENRKKSSLRLRNVSKLSAKNTSNGFEIFPIQNFCVT